LTVQRNRLDHARTRDDTRQWVQDRRARTRHLIELGGLVQKAGLVELVDDDRATLLGALLELASRLRRDDDTGDDPRHLATRWRRSGLRAFEAEREAQAHAHGPEVGVGDNDSDVITHQAEAGLDNGLDPP
jgi:Conjugal transfer protein TraD